MLVVINLATKDTFLFTVSNTFLTSFALFSLNRDKKRHIKAFYADFHVHFNVSIQSTLVYPTRTQEVLAYAILTTNKQTCIEWQK